MADLETSGHRQLAELDGTCIEIGEVRPEGWNITRQWRDLNISQRKWNLFPQVIRLTEGFQEQGNDVIGFFFFYEA